MHAIDWILIAVPLLIILGVGLYTRTYIKSVADFLSGGRLAGRYLLAVGSGEMALGAVCFVGAFEQFEHAGFTIMWWNWLVAPVGVLLTVTGFVTYRYRQTRVLTLAQFFEIRYSKKFRIVTGMLAFGAGILNFGIMPVISARFLTYFLGLPPAFHLFIWTVPTYALVLAVMLGVTTFLALSGGVITMLVMGCVEGMISQVLYLVIIFALLSMFSWSDISQTLGARPAGQSMLNPLDSFGLRDFNFWYVAISLLVSIYGTMAWQNQSAFNAAALSPHESRMGGIVGRWRDLSKAAVIPLLAACALTFLQHPHFAVQAHPARAEVAAMGDTENRSQMTIPIGLEHLLPPGVKGALCVILLMGSFGGDSSHIHSWGSILVQDVVLPLRRRSFAPGQHILYLRLAIAGVALFAFLFGIFFRQVDYIFMWWQVTMGLYIGGAGAAILGGLYWNRGTTAGAWVALIVGSGLSTAGILAGQAYGQGFPLNGLQISFVSSLLAFALYIGVSMLTCREPFNMDRMLHRGRYALAGSNPEPASILRRFTWDKVAGIDKDFTGGDRWMARAILGWVGLWFFVSAGGTLWNLAAPWPRWMWAGFWQIAVVGIPICLALVAAAWLLWGGTRDIRELFRRLRREKVNILDNGVVVDHANLSELERPGMQAALRTPPRDVETIKP